MDHPEASTPAPAGGEAAGERAPNGPALAFILLFLLLNLPVIAGLGRNTNDEQFYVDGAVRMLDSGDYLTPKTREGANRFNKPPLTYWMLAAGYKLLGVSVFSSRLPFLLAGGLTLWLAFRLAWALYRRRQAALLALAILGSCHLFVSNYTVSTTDGLLTLGVALSFLGFMRILFLGGRSGGDYASAYLGAALAALAKGAPGLLPVAFAWAFAWWRRRQGTSPRALVHVPAMLGGLLLAGGWPLAMLALHGGEFVHGLAADQVGNRLEGSRWYLNWLYFPATCAEFLLPWYLPLLALAFRDRPALAEGWRRHRESFLFAAGWAAVLLVVLLPSNLYRSRYVLPAIPLLAVLLAGWLLAVDREELLARCWKVVGLVMAGAGALCGTGLILLGRELDPRFGLGGLLLALLAAGLVPAALRARAARPYLIAGFLLAACAVNSLLLQVYMKASPGPEIAGVLKRSAPARPEVAVVGTVLPKFRSHVRMCMGGKVDFVERDAAAVKALAPKVLLFTAEERARLDLAGYRVTEAGESYNSFRLGRYLQARWRGRGPAYLEKCRARYFVAIRAG